MMARFLFLFFKEFSFALLLQRENNTTKVRQNKTFVRCVRACVTPLPTSVDLLFRDRKSVV